MFRICHEFKKISTKRALNFTFQPSSGNNKVFCNQRSNNFSSRTRRRRQNASRLSSIQDENKEAEDKRKKTQFQVKDMLESTSTGLFIPRDKDGNEVTMGEYLQFASLSPWVPCPDAVARRALDIAKVNADDVHYELGSGDGRMNFHAIDLYNAKKSVGIDIDTSLVQQSNDRILKRHPAPKHIEFICADLMDHDNSNTAELWKVIGKDCTILTMYFVEEALEKIKPLIEKHLLGSSCRIITIGYQVGGWQPQWSEVILGLSINLYRMENSNELLNGEIQHMEETSDDDAELNKLSKAALVAEEEEEVDSNPFKEQKNASMQSVEDEYYVDYHWDFDENEEFDDDITMNSNTHNSR